MGPLASAEFLKTLYELHADEREQEAPACVLISDPGIPDRTEAIIAGSEGDVLAPLLHALDGLERLGVSRVLMVCISIHHWIPRMPPALRAKVISLLDVVVDELRASPGPHLLLCSTGARRARLFEEHPRWAQVAARVVLPDDADQDRIHSWIFRIKRNGMDDAMLDGVEEMVRGYGAVGFVAGCSELHLLSNALRLRGGDGGVGRIDPLLVVARDARRLLADG